MEAEVAQQVARARRVVVKIGTGVLTQRSARLDRTRLAAVAREVAALRGEGPCVCLVSSGAVAMGLERLGGAPRRSGLAFRQAAAAIGQPHLMGAWEDAFDEHGILAAQILLTHADMASRRRFLNARHTFQELFDAQVLPIINENDSVATEEIQFGDNDRLAALVTSVIEADLLVLLTDVDGLYDRDPGAPGARLVEVVHEVDDETFKVAGGAGPVGTGGMRSKVEAAHIAAHFGVPTVVMNGCRPESLRSLRSGRPQGTLFLPRRSPLAARKHWIAYTLRPAGTLTVDAGAERALRQYNRSLLPAGVVGVEGDFEVGDPVRVVGPDGKEIARGLASYGARDLARIQGRPSSEIEAVLGYRYDDEAVHKEDLVLV